MKNSTGNSAGQARRGEEGLIRGRLAAQSWLTQGSAAAPPPAGLESVAARAGQAAFQIGKTAMDIRKLCAAAIGCLGGMAIAMAAAAPALSDSAIRSAFETRAGADDFIRIPLGNVDVVTGPRDSCRNADTVWKEDEAYRAILAASRAGLVRAIAYDADGPANATVLPRWVLAAAVGPARGPDRALACDGPVGLVAVKVIAGNEFLTGRGPVTRFYIALSPAGAAAQACDCGNMLMLPTGTASVRAIVRNDYFKQGPDDYRLVLLAYDAAYTPAYRAFFRTLENRDPAGAMKARVLFHFDPLADSWSIVAEDLAPASADFTTNRAAPAPRD
jgi:hypothetical protein